MTDVQTETTSSPAEADVVETTAVGTDATDESTQASTDVEPTAGELDREGDIAADYIEELLDIADIDGDIDIDARNGRAYISVNAEDGTDRKSVV